MIGLSAENSRLKNIIRELEEEKENGVDPEIIKELELLRGAEELSFLLAKRYVSLSEGMLK